MNKFILISLLCGFSAISVLSQTNEQIILKKRRYYVNDKQLTSKELKTLLQSEPESAIQYKRATNNSTIGSVSIGAGLGFCIYAIANPPSEKEGPLPGLISDDEMIKHLTPLFIGAGLVFIGVPFLIMSNKHVKSSIIIYNSKHTTGYTSLQKLDLGITQNGLRMTYHF